MAYNEFSIGIVFYYPTKEQVNKVKEYSKLVNKIYIYDNSENNDDEYAATVTNIKGCDYFSHNLNDGIAKALNSLCQKSKLEGHNYILLLDQDSEFDLENISRLFEAVLEHQNKKIGVFAPESVPIKSLEECNQQKLLKSQVGIHEVKWKITSGSVIDLNAWESVRGFDEDLFIDKVDYDYCINLKKKGLKTVVVNNSILFQFLGEPNGGIINYSEHNYIRHYYIFRNRLYIYNKYDHKSKKIKKMLALSLSIFRHIFIIAFLENDKLKKFKAIKLGYVDYKNNRLGKCKHF